MTRAGWTSRGRAAVGALSVLAAGCARSPREAPLSSSTTPAVGTYTPGSIILYEARRELVGRCRDDLSDAIELSSSEPALSAPQRVEVEKWALCLQRPELQHASVVLVPSGDDAAAVAGRARQVRDALVAGGVNEARVRITAALETAGRSAPPHGDTVRVELAVPEASR